MIKYVFFLCCLIFSLKTHSCQQPDLTLCADKKCKDKTYGQFLNLKSCYRGDQINYPRHNAYELIKIHKRKKNECVIYYNQEKSGNYERYYCTLPRSLNYADLNCVKSFLKKQACKLSKKGKVSDDLDTLLEE